MLVLPFLTERNWRWTAAFVAWLGAVAAAIYAVHGAQPFLDFLHNARGVYAWTDLCFRENSIDSFLRSTAALVGGPFALVDLPLVRLLAKASVLALALALAGIAIRRGAFVSGRGAGKRRPQRLAGPGRAHGAGVAPRLGASPGLRRAAVSRDHAAGCRRRANGPPSASPTSSSTCCPRSTSIPGRSDGWRVCWCCWPCSTGPRAASRDGDVFRFVQERLGGARVA